MTTKTDLQRTACGLPVLMLENPNVQVATADVWVRTGAADEPQEVAGISHFLEHMMFKGTEKWGLGQIERAIEQVGGVCNAATSHDYTHYYVTMPSDKIATGVAMLAEMTRHSTLDAEEIEKERLVILEEYRRKQDYPVGVLYERLYEELFEQGPYHRPVIGYEQTIRAIDRPAMADYFRRRYSPANMALVVTGHFDAAQIMEAAEQAFAGFDRPLEVLTTPAPTLYAAGRTVHVTKTTGGEVYVTFAFPAPGLASPDQMIPLDMAQFILGQGRASILHQRLKEERGLCSSISTYFPTHLHDSLFVVVATAQPGQVDALRAGVLEELDRFVQADPEPDQFRRAARLLTSGHWFSLETSGGAAGSVGYYYTLTGGTQFQDEYLERLEQVTPAQVRAAAAGCLGEGGGAAGRMVQVSVGPDADN